MKSLRTEGMYLNMRAIYDKPTGNAIPSGVKLKEFPLTSTKQGPSLTPRQSYSIQFLKS